MEVIVSRLNVLLDVFPADLENHLPLKVYLFLYLYSAKLTAADLLKTQIFHKLNNTFLSCLAVLGIIVVQGRCFPKLKLILSLRP